MKIGLQRFAVQPAVVLAGFAVALLMTGANPGLVSAEEPATPGDVPETVISGVVKDADDKPVEGARVWFVAFRTVDGAPMFEWKSVGESATDADGRFQWRRQRPIDERCTGITAFAHSRDESSGWTEYCKVDQSHEVMISLSATRAINGRLVGPEDKPIKNARIRLSSFSFGKRNVRNVRGSRARGSTLPEELGNELLVTTDADGSFTMTGLPTEAASISAAVETEEYGNPTLTFDLDEPLVLSLERTGSVEGRVEPLPEKIHRAGVRVRIQPDFRQKVSRETSFDANYSSLIPIGQDGSFQFRVPPGKWDVSAVIDRSVPWVPVKLGSHAEVAAAGDIRKITVGVVRAVAVRGRIVEKAGGKPVSGACVTLYELAARLSGKNFEGKNAWNQTICFTDKQGQFQAFVHPGHFFVRATRFREIKFPGFEPKNDARLTKIAGEKIDLRDVVLDTGSE
ncbi:MAG: carboxypeptidase regulatory-like domain-containing protein [Planctomycetaceae bacterium]|nr:carboxypeptidase regulatory-like domain-containing protein [Planctomycetaceae bacterium]